jgi:oligoribonuclease (3'-5' exoribonuclease)
MKYISIDIETTGLSHYSCQILQFAAIFEDTNVDLMIDKLPYFNTFIKHDYFQFEENALKMHANSGLLEEYFNAEKIEKEEIVHEFIKWLQDLGYEKNDDGQIEIVVAGKNYNAFDRNFLHNVPYWIHEIKDHRRVLDPAILYVDWEEDKVPPNLVTCLYRSDPQYEINGVEIKITHNALEDAREVVRVIRNSQKHFIWT